MAFTLSYPPGFVDVPDSQLAAGQVANGPVLSAIKSNADFGAVAYEIFQTQHQSGDTVPLPLSPVDNYEYSREECKYSWEISNTTNPGNGLPGGNGGLLGGTWNVDQATGKVTCFEVYEVEGGASTDTDDGVLTVWTHAVRGLQVRTTSAQPAYTALNESAFVEDAALDSTTLTELSKNAKASAVSVESFIMNPSGAPAWTPETNITAGALIQPTAKWANGCWYIAANSGLTGATEPGPWPSQPGYSAGIIDGGVIWNLAGWGFMNGQQIPLPVSPIDGYAYLNAEVAAAIPFHASTFSLPRQTGITVSFTSGEGNIRAISKSITQNAPAASVATQIGANAPVYSPSSSVYTAKTVYPGMPAPPAGMANMPANPAPNAATTGAGIANCSVAYENGVFDDGTVHVLLICVRSLAANVPAGGGATFTDFPTTELLTGGTPNVTNLNNITRNANFSILRPEVFTNQVTPGNAVPVPTSRSGYVYSRAELEYIWFWTNTGSAPGRLRDFSVTVNPQTGVLETRTDYFRGGYKTGYGNICSAVYGYPGSPIRSQMPDTTSGIPLVTVITIALRQHETRLQPVYFVSTPGTSQPAPPSENNLLPNPGFEIWSRMQLAAVNVVGVADDWYQGQNSGTTAFLQEAGIVGNFAQGIGAQCAAATLANRGSTATPASASIVSDQIAIEPGGLYSLGVIGKSSPNTINYGFYVRVHILDINGSNDTTFELAGTVTAQPGTGVNNNPGTELTATSTKLAYTFTMPQNGATFADTSSGNSVLSQTLTFDPAYAYVEYLLWNPTYAGYTGGSLVLFAILDQAYFVFVKEAATVLTPQGVQVTLPDGVTLDTLADVIVHLGSLGKWWQGNSSSWYPSAGGDESGVPTAATIEQDVNYHASQNFAGSTALPAAINPQYFYARFTGYFQAAEGTTYTLGVNASGGVNVIIEGQQLISALSASQAAAADLTFTNSVQWTAPVKDTAGNTYKYQLVIEWQNATETPALQFILGPPSSTTGIRGRVIDYKIGGTVMADGTDVNTVRNVVTKQNEIVGTTTLTATTAPKTSTMAQLHDWVGNTSSQNPGTYGTGLDNVADSPSGRVAALRFAFNYGGNGSAFWILVGTWTAAVAGRNLKMSWISGAGYNPGLNQQSEQDLNVRLANATAAPNITGATLTGVGGAGLGLAIAQVKIVAHGGSTSPGNAVWDVYAEYNPFTVGHLDISMATGDQFAYSGTTASDPGTNSQTIVSAIGGQLWTPDGHLPNRVNQYDPSGIRRAPGLVNYHTLGAWADDPQTNRSAHTPTTVGQAITDEVFGISAPISAYGSQVSSINLPGAFEVDVYAVSGGVVDVFLPTQNPPQNGYIYRVDTRSAEPVGQLVRMDTSTNLVEIGTSQVAANNGALASAWFTLRGEYKTGGRLDVYVNGAWCCTALDTTYAPNGNVFIAYEIQGNQLFSPVGFSSKSSDHLPSGVQTLIPTQPRINNGLDNNGNLLFKNIFPTTFPSGQAIGSSTVALNPSVVLSTKGKPVFVVATMFLAAGSGADANVYPYLYRDGSAITNYVTTGSWDLRAGKADSKTFVWLDNAPNAATHSYQMHAFSDGSGATLNGGTFTVYEFA